MTNKNIAILIVSLLFSLLAQADDEVAKSEYVFELRTYTSAPGKLDDLLARFRDHTTALIEKHGMKVVGFWVPTDEEKKDNTLIYILSHRNRQAADQSFNPRVESPP